MDILEKSYNYLDLLLDRHFDLRKGERRKVILLQINAFTLISILLILKPVFTSNMLSYHGITIMPLAYVLIAISAVIVHNVVSRFSVNKSLIKTIGINHAANIVTLCAVGISLYLEVLSGWMSILLYIYISLFALVTITYFYQYCQSLLTIRDAKRIYAYIGSGAIAGGVFGGYFTSILVPLVGSAGLVIISAILLLFSGYIMYLLNYHYSQDSDEGQNNISTSSSTSANISAVRNKHVLHISLIIGLGVIVSKLVDYQFNFVAINSIKTSDELTSFLGFWFSNINMFGLLLQLFVVSKIIDRLGVSKSMSIMPILLLIVGICFIIFPLLGFAIALKCIEGSLKQSVYKTATEINIMPLAPSLRNKAKTLVDVVVDSLATGTAGILIYFIVNQLDLPLQYIMALTITVTMIWIYFIFKSKITYTHQLSLMVKGESQPMVENESLSPQSKKIYINEIILNSISRGKDPKAILLDLINSDDVLVRKSAILKLAKDYRHEARQTLMRHLDDPSIQVRKAIYYSLIMMAKSPKEVNLIYANTTDYQYTLITAALAESIENNARQKEIYQLYDRIDESYNRISFHENNEANVKYIGQIFRAITKSRYKQKYHLVRSALYHSFDPDIQKEAIRSIGYGHPPALFVDLKYDNVNEGNRKTLHKAIAQYPKRFLYKASILIFEDQKALVNYLPVFQYIDSQKHLNFLFKLLDAKNLRVRRAVLKTINILRKKFPHLNFNKRKNHIRLIREIRSMRNLSMCKSILLQEYKNSDDINYKHQLGKIDRGINRQLNASILHVFIYLAIITQRNDIGVIYNAIKSNRKDKALDYLDGILTYRIRRQLIPTLELVTQKNFEPAALEGIGLKVKNIHQIKKILSKYPDKKLKETLKATLFL